MTAPQARPSPEAQVGFGQPLAIQPAVKTDPVPPQLTTEFGVRQHYPRRSRRKAMGFLITMVFAAVFIGIVGGLLVMQLNREPVATNSSGDPLLPKVSSEASPSLDEIDARPERSRRVSPASTPPDRPAIDPVSRPIPKQELFFFSKTQYKECWRSVQPHLVALEIESSFGNRTAVATIVDSRGWILTSYQAVKDAWKIEVTASVKSLDDLEETEPLKDLVRGIVATDPAHDLAILAINRRFVVSFADAKVSEDHGVVRGEFLMQAAPPSRQAPYGLDEIKIQQRAKLDQLGSQAQSKAKLYEVGSTDVAWLTFSSDQPVYPGTPLFRIDGTMVAMTSFAVEQTGYAVPVDKVRELVDSADGELQRLTMPTAVTDRGSTVSLAADSPARQVTMDLNQSGQKCEAFQFFPETREQYPALQEFSRHVIAAFDFLTESEDEAGVQLVQETLDQWEQKLQAQVGYMIARERNRLRKINEFAADQVKRGDKTHVVFFGNLYVGGIQSPRLILRFDDRDQYVSVPFDPTTEPMLPGTNWLFFVETMALARQREISVADVGRIPTDAATLLYAVGPIPDN